MTGIAIGASSESVYALKLAKTMGIKTIAIDGNEEAEGLNFADDSKVIDISDIEKVYDLCITMNVNFVIPVPIGRCLLTTGIINERLNYIGISEKNAIASTDKWVFKNKLSEYKLNNGKYYLIDRNNPDNEYNIKYPSILKPRFGSGSRGIKIVENEKELKTILNNNFINEDYIIEELFFGVEYGIDAVIFDNKLDLILVREKLLTEYPERQAIGYLSVVDNDIITNIEKYLRIVNNSLGFNNCLMHADLILNEDRINIIEMAARPSGHSLHNNFTIKATDIDMLKLYYLYQKTREINLYQKKIQPLGIFYFDLPEGTVKSLPKFDQIEDVVEYRCDIQIGSNIKRVSSGNDIMPRGYFIVKGKNPENIILLKDTILKSFEVGYE